LNDSCVCLFVKIMGEKYLLTSTYHIADSDMYLNNIILLTVTCTSTISYCWQWHVPQQYHIADGDMYLNNIILLTVTCTSTISYFWHSHTPQHYHIPDSDMYLNTIILLTVTCTSTISYSWQWHVLQQYHIPDSDMYLNNTHRTLLHFCGNNGYESVRLYNVILTVNLLFINNV
jgi:hypothetical protein